MVTVGRTKRSASPKGRILGTRVPALFPAKGTVSALIYGEAPGPNGADKSRIPFFGDRAGRPLYEALEEEGRCRFTRPLEGVRWDGAALREAGILPVVTDAALSNAYAICPTDDSEHFRAPSKAEMSSAANVRRVQGELAKARRRGLHTVIVLGRHADWLLGTHLGLRDDPTIAYHQITHPSPLGLMGMAKRAGKGVRVSAMKERWQQEFRRMLRSRP
jgi:uracil DNA glycosylase superfamily protein